MARIRTIKPEFWTDEKVVQLPYEARLLFIGLWNFADDDGYLLDEPERIRLQILPGDNLDCDVLLDLLVAAELLDRIDLEDGRTALSIPGFPRHQKISHKAPTRLPVARAIKRSLPAAERREIAIKYGCKPGERAEVACYYCGAPGSICWFKLQNGRPSAWVAFGGVEFDHFIPETSGGETTSKNIVLSCRYCNRSKGHSDGLSFLSRTFQSAPEFSGNLRPEGKGIEKEKDIKAQSLNRASPASLRSAFNGGEPQKNEEAEFERWYTAFPRHVSKGRARKAYWQARKKADATALLVGVERYRRSKPDYADWCHPATWLNGERWLDETGDTGEQKPAKLNPVLTL